MDKVRKKDISIQVIRIVSMLLIVICHLCNYSNNKIISYLGNFFDVGVFIFFLISGYLYGNKKIDNKWEWIKKRVSVILVPMYVFLVFLIWLNITTTGGINIKQTLPYLFNVQYFYGNIQGGGHLWFLTVIMICYLLLPLLNKYEKTIKDKKYIIIPAIIILSVITGLFSKKIGLLGFYILTFYLGYLLKNYSKQVFNMSTIKAVIAVIIGVVVRLVGKIAFDDTLFYETTITGVTHILIAIGAFVVIYKFVSKLQIKKVTILNIINEIDKLSYNIFIVHYMYIIGPLHILDMTKYYIINLCIFLFATVISAYALNIFVEMVKKLYVGIKKYEFKKVKDIHFLQCLEVALIVIYKFLLAYDYRNKVVLYTIAFLSGLAFLGVFYFKIKEYKKKDLIVFCILGVLAFITVITLKSINLVFPLMLALAFYNESPKKIAKVFFYALLICFILTIILNMLNILPDNNHSRLINGKSWIRYSLGFSNPAFVMLYYVFIVLAAYCAFGCSKKFFVLSNFGTIILYCLSLSRTALVCLIVLDLILLIESKLKIIGKMIKLLVPYAFGLLVITLVIITILSTYFELSTLDYLLSGRLEFNQEFYNRGYFKTLFGVSNTLDIPLDNYYLYPLIKFGIVGCVIYVILTYFSLSKLKNNKEIMIAQIIVLLYGMGDTNVIVTSINFIISIQVLALINSENKYILKDNKEYEECK